MLGSCGSRRVEECGQLLPSCMLAVLHAPADGKGPRHAGPIVPLVPGQAKQKEQKGSCLKDPLSSYIASCCE